MNQEKLTKDELRCIARFYQSVIFKGQVFGCCRYCRLYSECTKDINNMMFDKLRNKKKKLTGVHLGMLIPDEELLKKGN